MIEQFQPSVERQCLVAVLDFDLNFDRGRLSAVR